jgi:hypothetical protein
LRDKKGRKIEEGVKVLFLYSGHDHQAVVTEVTEMGNVEVAGVLIAAEKVEVVVH